MIGRIKDGAMLVFAIVFAALLVVYNRTRIPWRAGDRLAIVPDHIPIVDAIVSASEWTVVALVVVLVVWVGIGKVRALIGV